MDANTGQAPAAVKLTIDEVTSQSGVSARTLRRWVRAGLLPGPLGRSRNSHYDASHVARARAIQGLREQGLSMRAIRNHLAAAALPLASASLTAPVATDAPATRWDVIQLSESLVLMVRADHQDAREVANEIYRHYRA